MTISALIAQWEDRWQRLLVFGEQYEALFDVEHESAHGRIQELERCIADLKVLAPDTIRHPEDKKP